MRLHIQIETSIFPKVVPWDVRGKKRNINGGQNWRHMARVGRGI